MQDYDDYLWREREGINRRVNSADTLTILVHERADELMDFKT